MRKVIVARTAGLDTWTRKNRKTANVTVDREFGQGGEDEMTKSEVKKALDEIRDMSDEEIAINSQFIRKVSEAAFALIKSLERR